MVTETSAAAHYPLPSALPVEDQDARLARLAAHADRALAPSGWRIREMAVNLETGFVRLQFLRNDGDATVRLVTILRSAWGCKVTLHRELGDVRAGCYRDFLDFSQSVLFGRESREGLRSALRGAASYIADNPAPGRLGGSKEPLRLLAGALAERGAA